MDRDMNERLQRTIEPLIAKIDANQQVLTARIDALGARIDDRSALARWVVSAIIATLGVVFVALKFFESL